MNIIKTINTENDKCAKQYKTPHNTEQIPAENVSIKLAKKESNENPVFYISYAYARICSILKENQIKEVNLKYENINNEDAYKLLEKIYNFKNVVKDAAKKEIPHLIANYCYELANLFHIYYSKHRILTENEMETAENLNLITAVKITLGNALSLIGVIPPEKM